MARRIGFVSIFVIVLTLFVISACTSYAKPKAKKDYCKVVAYAGGVFKEDLAMITEVDSTPEVSKQCLDFANRLDVKNSVCNFQGNGTIEMIQIRSYRPGSQEVKSHCHYQCLGFTNSSCESNCNARNVRIPTKIGQMDCPQNN